MRKKVCLAIAAFALIALLTGIPYLIDGIRERGMSGVNYGRILFPLLICAGGFLMARRS